LEELCERRHLSLQMRNEEEKFRAKHGDKKKEREKGGGSRF
jgi:hypothetical protein